MNWIYGIGIFANNDIRSDNDLTIKQFYNRRKIDFLIFNLELCNSLIEVEQKILLNLPFERSQSQCCKLKTYVWKQKKPFFYMKNGFLSSGR